MKLTRLFALGLLAAAPLALAACGDDAAPGEVAEGEALPAVTAPVGSSWTETVTVTPEGGFMLGNPDAPLKLIEFASHTCGHCATFSVTASSRSRASMWRAAWSASNSARSSSIPSTS